MQTEAALILMPDYAAADAPTAAAPSRLLSGVREWIRRSTHDARDRYLSQAVDHVDLELRMCSWEAKERRDARFACGGLWN